MIEAKQMPYREKLEGIVRLDKLVEILPHELWEKNWVEKSYKSCKIFGEHNWNLLLLKRLTKTNTR